jgi:hypothetical protein
MLSQGHHVLVLSRDRVRASGSPWCADALDEGPRAAASSPFRADNPGLWMDHCPNLKHAATGLTMHLAYVSVSTPFKSTTPAGTGRSNRAYRRTRSLTRRAQRARRYLGSSATRSMRSNQRR